MRGFKRGVTKLNWKIDKLWADQYLPEIEVIVRDVAGLIIGVRLGTEEEDCREATDYVVYVSAGAIACRVRRNCQYRDLTLRASRPSGVHTELAKIREGWARWYLYLWVDEGKVRDWIVVDLDMLRASGLLESKCRRQNLDGTTFLPISVAELEDRKCLVARRIT